MSARIPPGFAELWIQFNASTDPEPMYVALGLDLAVGVGGTQTVTNLITNTASTAIDNAVSSDLTVGPGHIIYGQDGGDVRIDGASSPTPGLAAAASIPSNGALLVRKLTTAGGRRGRGRMYIPGVPEGNVTFSGTFTGGWQATAQTAVDNLRTTLLALAEVEDLVLFHDTAPFTPTPITSLEVQPKIATQRRRMRP